MQESLPLAETILELKETLAKSIIEEAKHLDEVTQLKAQNSAFTSFFGGLDGAS